MLDWLWQWKWICVLVLILGFLLACYGLGAGASRANVRPIGPELVALRGQVEELQTTIAEQYKQIDSLQMKLALKPGPPPPAPPTKAEPDEAGSPLDPHIHHDYVYDNINGWVEANIYALPVWISAGEDGYGNRVPSEDYQKEAAEWDMYQKGMIELQNFTQVEFISSDTGYKNISKIKANGQECYVWDGALIRKGRFMNTAERIKFEQAQAHERATLMETQ